MQYYLSKWNSSNFELKNKIKEGNDNRLYKFVRNYNGRKSVYYTETSLFFRWMYIYPGDFVEKAVLSFIEIKNKCSDKSIKAAFEDCPNIYNWLNDFVDDNISKICVLNINGNEYYCLRETYFTFLTSKKRNFKLLCQKADVFRNEITLIKTERLEPSFGQKLKKFFAQSTKYVVKFVVRAGVVVAASAIGANIDLPDFEFDLDTPDIDIPDFDTDFDIDTSGAILSGADFDTDIDDGGNVLGPTDGYNVSFGSQYETLTSIGGQELKVKIDKKPGTANQFIISSNKGTAIVSGSDNWVKFNQINYELPKLRG